MRRILPSLLMASGAALAAAPDPHFDLSTLTTQVVVAASSEWIPVRNEAEVEKGSALDFSELCGKRVPAGTYGRVVARGGHFEFEKLPGVPQRFYGVNICTTANYLEPATAERFAERLCRMGYNALRLHHHDGGLVAGSKDSVTPNPAQFAKLDALVAACVKRGIYLTTDLYVSRKIPFRELGKDLKGDGGKWPFKELVLYNANAQSNFFAFARNFLTHVNPHTGRRYADEPALAWISLVNEGNHGHHGANFCKQFPEGEASWRAWLKDRRREDPKHYGDVPEALPKNTWSRKSKHNSAFSLFAADLEREFDAKAKRFLREELGCRALVSSINGGVNPPCYQLPRAAVFDYVDDHFYFDHPSFLKQRWSLPSRLANTVPFVAAKKSDLGVKGCVLKRLYDRPYMVTEFNYSGPNDYRGVGGLLAGALAGLQDWGGMWRFAWSHGERGIASPETVVTHTFDLCGDILNRASERAAMCLFLRGDIAALKPKCVWMLPERKLRAVSKFSPYDPPAWSGAAWWLRVGSSVDEVPPADADKTVDYEKAYEIGRSEVIGDLPCGGGAVGIDATNGWFTVATPRTCGAFALAGRRTAGALEVDFGKSCGTVWASSLDGRPLGESRHVLVTHLTDLKNTGMAFANRERTILLDWGRLPLVARNARARVSLALAAGDWRAYRLSCGGRRVGTCATKQADGRLAFDANVAADPNEATMLYELVR